MNCFLTAAVSVFPHKSVSTLSLKPPWSWGHFSPCRSEVSRWRASFQKAQAVHPQEAGAGQGQTWPTLLQTALLRGPTHPAAWQRGTRLRFSDAHGGCQRQYACATGWPSARGYAGHLVCVDYPQRPAHGGSLWRYGDTGHARGGGRAYSCGRASHARGQRTSPDATGTPSIHPQICDVKIGSFKVPRKPLQLHWKKHKVVLIGLSSN